MSVGASGQHMQFDRCEGVAMDGRHIVELLRVPADELAPYLTARSGRTTRVEHSSGRCSARSPGMSAT